MNECLMNGVQSPFQLRLSDSHYWDYALALPLFYLYTVRNSDVGKNKTLNLIYFSTKGLKTNLDSLQVWSTCYRRLHDSPFNYDSTVSFKKSKNKK